MEQGKATVDIYKEGNIKDINPLTIATGCGWLDVMKYLIAQKANVNPKLHQTPLSAAAFNGHVGAIEILLNSGADINARERTGGVTALCLAASEGHPNAVKVLLKKGANAELALATGETPLILAVREGHLQVVQVLLNHRKKLLHDEHAALHVAINKGHVLIAKELVKSGANVNAASLDSGLRCLEMAAKSGNLAIVEELVKGGAVVNINNVSTSLFCAAAEGHYSCALYLLKQGANPNNGINNLRFCTPLFVAARNGHEHIVKLLLQNGAEMDQGAQIGALIYSALQKNQVATAKKLVRDLNILEEVSTRFFGLFFPFTYVIN